MNVVVWLVEGTWEGCVRSSKQLLPPGAHVTLLHVTPSGVDELPEAAAGGLLGRGPRGHRPDHFYEKAADLAASEMISTAARDLEREVEVIMRHGHPEREVVTVAADAGADLLVVARDGERDRLGPHSLGHATRFVVDHAPCAVLLVWPEEPPGIGSLPPPKHHHGPRPPEHGPGRRGDHP